MNNDTHSPNRDTAAATSLGEQSGMTIAFSGNAALRASDDKGRTSAGVASLSGAGACLGLFFLLPQMNTRCHVDLSAVLDAIFDDEPARQIVGKHTPAEAASAVADPPHDTSLVSMEPCSST